MSHLTAFALLALCTVFLTSAVVGRGLGRGFAEKTASRGVLYDNDWGLHAALNLSAWRSQLFLTTQKFIVSKGNNDKPPAWERYEIFQPYISCPPDRPLRRVGSFLDGAKWLCEPAALKQPCVVLSFGSAMEFSFEEAILNETSCDVITFDCTVLGRSLSARHKFRPVCLGSSDAAKEDPVFVTYGQLVSALGFDEIPILKVDIESYEFPLFAEWREHSRGLPEQIAVEIHWDEGQAWHDAAELHPHWGRGDYGVADLALFFFHLANLGYGIVHQEVNKACKSCSEFTLLRVEAAVPSPHAR